eukprot:CAMPEP_0177577850 /NCGR_PEP_ID=MMETSP0419_2-20121207/5_1 /TAXON_ID=582737 /ORGANISM="Tetraselmis sp., Strain GSL018" /LENGTH=166 /DNA_ID=CAMNT_0019066195 /DNA_START=256 /DNA_END=756 /DNA_ORIENTATION=+
MTGHTAEYADIIKEKLGTTVTEPLEVGEIDIQSLVKYEGLIVGAPTWHTGADVARSGTAWDDVLEEIAALKLAGKPCAVFGLGDSASYSENFCDAIEEIHNTFAAAGCQMVGYVSAADYNFDDSKSVNSENKFLGLALDYENEDDKAEERIDAWCKQLVSEMSLKI